MKIGIQCPLITDHMHKSLAPKTVVCLSPYCMIYNSSWAKDFFLSQIIPYFFLSHIIQYLHGRFFRRWNFHRKTIIDNVMFPYISLMCPTFTLWPRKSSIFPIFVIYWPRFCPFVYFVIVQYCIYCPIYRPILYLCFLGGNHPRNIHQKYGYHCWTIFLIRLILMITMYIVIMNTITILMLTTYNARLRSIMSNSSRTWPHTSVWVGEGACFFGVRNKLCINWSV